MTSDIINGTFEFTGSIALWWNVRTLYVDKQVKGLSLYSMLFFTTWGIWNMYYYPSLHQWLSFLGDVSITTANMVYISLMIYYSRYYSEGEAL